MIFDRLSQLVAQNPERPMYTFLRNGQGKQEAEIWTAGETYNQIHSLAEYLRASTGPGSLVLILLPPGLEFIRAFFACILAGLIAVPAMPANFAMHAGARRRITSIIENATFSAVLHDKLGGRALKDALSSVLPTDVAWVAIEDVPCSTQPQNGPWTADPATTVLLQYTSGSTGAPKGVQVTLGNILHNSNVISRTMGFSADSRLVSWLPFFHDMGLFSCVIQPMVVGFPAMLMPPAVFMKSPASWLQAVTSFQATVSGAPNFAYDLCVDKVSAAEKRDLDLRNWQVAFNGAEPIRTSTLDRFTKAFGDCGFRPSSIYTCYGLAEATLMVSGSAVGGAVARKSMKRRALEEGRVVFTDAEPSADVLELASSGHAHGVSSATGNKCCIVDSETLKEVPALHVGEIVVSGDSVTRGYWCNPAATADVIAVLMLKGDTEPAPYLRTGDLGFIDDGQLFVTGRRKDVIISRGRNLYPQDIEESFESIAQLDDKGNCVVFTLEDEANTPVLVQQLSRQNWRHVASGPDDEAKARLTALLDLARANVNAVHGLWLDQICLVRPMSLPKTTSGKVQRSKTRALFVTNALSVGFHLAGRGPRSDGTETFPAALLPDCDVTRKVYEIWCKELNLSGFSPDLDFFALGGTSLQAASIVAGINDHFETQLDLLDLLDTPVLQAVVARVKETLSDIDAHQAR